MLSYVSLMKGSLLLFIASQPCPFPASPSYNNKSKHKSKIQMCQFFSQFIWLKLPVIICYAPSNIWKNRIRGHVKMNSWSANEIATGKIFHTFFLAHWNIKFFNKYSYTKVHLDMTSKQVLSDVKWSIAYYNSWF
jgi:hypothetical protein